jgi:O-antigen/teichoic acid export membrane protein
MATAPTQSKLLDQQETSTRELVSDSIATGILFALVLTVGQRVIGFGRGILFCRLMTDQQLGQWSMVWSFLMMLAPLAVLGLPGCFGRYTEHFRQRGQLGSFVKRIAVVSSVLTALVAGSLIVFPSAYSWLIFRDAAQAPVVVSLGICLIVVTAYNFCTSLVESLRQVRLVTLMRFITGVTFAVVGTLLIMSWQDASCAATIGFAISSLVGGIPAAWVLWRFRSTFKDTGEKLVQRKLWKKIAPFAAWLWLSNFFNNMFEVADRYMLIHWSPVDAVVAQGYVGQYHSGRVVPVLLVSVAAMLAGVLMPYMSANWEAGKKDETRKQLNWTIKIMGIAFTFGGFLVIMLSPILFDHILQGRYNDGLAVLPLTLVYCIWFSLFTVGQDYLWVAEKGGWATAVVVFGLIVNIVLNIFLIPMYGLYGAVMATTLANAVNVVGIYVLNHRFGCTTDVGVWLCGIVPLVLLMNPMLGLAMLGIVVIAGVKTNLLFSGTEKQEIVSSSKKLIERIKRRGKK